MLREFTAELSAWIPAVADYAVVGTGLIVSDTIRTMYISIEKSKRLNGFIHIRLNDGDNTRETELPATFGFMNTVRFIGTVVSDHGTVTVDCMDGQRRIIDSVVFPLGPT